MLRVLHHVCIETGNYEGSLRFYRDVLGFSPVRETGGRRGRRFNTWLRNVDIMIELETPKRSRSLFSRLPWFGVGGVNHLCFLVDDISREVERIVAAGYNRFKKKDGGRIYEIGGVRQCKVVAPEGTVIELREQDICF